MAEEIEKHDTNMALFSNIKKECEDENLDNKICVWETAMNISDMETDVHVSDDKIKQCEIVTVDNIKIETSPYDVHTHKDTPDNIKIEDVVSSDVIKSEFNNELLFCDNCNADYQDYCAKCGMLVHILNRNTLNHLHNRAIEGIPINILEIRESFEDISIFTLKVIPKDVKFGPFNGISTAECSRKIKRGRFVVGHDRLQYLNWMQYIKPAKNIFEKNLFPLQSDGRLYYYTTREIRENEELLVYFGQEYEDSLNKDTEMDFIPPIECDAKEVFACTFCSLGFNSRVYLAKHKSICPNKVNMKFSLKELVQCHFCKIHLGKGEYVEYHMTYCYKRNIRKSFPLAEIKKKSQRCQIYTCTQCRYKTMYKGDYKSHTNRHYQVKKHKCDTCFRRFNTIESLKIHVENIHKTEGNEYQKFSTKDYIKVNRYKDQFPKNETTKPFKCSSCEFRTKYRYYLKVHVEAKHVKEFIYKCESCEYRACTDAALRKHTRTTHGTAKREHKVKNELNLKRPTKRQHSKECIYKCMRCEYKTKNWTNLKSHIKTRHLKEYDYKCSSCKYQTNYKQKLDSHVKTIHLKEFRFLCRSCDYKTNANSSLQLHIKSKHLLEFNYECESCDHKAVDRSSLKLHMKTKHLEQFSFKCESCEYKTNHKFSIKEHVKTKHLQEFDFKCEICDYKTNWKSHLNMHIKRKHTQDVDYHYHKCPECEYESKYKTLLEKHIKTVHLNEFDYKCDSCEYKTNAKYNLTQHIKSVHLKEYHYKCESCDYQTNNSRNLRNHVKSKHVDEIKLDP